MAVKSSPAKAVPKPVAKTKAAAPGKLAAKSPAAKVPAAKAPAAKVPAAKAPVGKAKAVAPTAKSAVKPAAKGMPTKTGKAAPPAPAVQATVTIKHMAERFGESHAMTKKQAESVLIDIVDMLVTHLKAGDRLRINGLGILEVKNRPARMGRNPATGASIQIAASKKIAFRPSKELKGSI